MDSIAKDQERFFEKITDLFPFGIMLVGPSHDIEYRNKQFDEIFGHGYPKSVNLSQWFNTTFPDQDFRKQARDILLYEMPYTQNDGKRTYAALSMTNQGREKLVSFTSLKLENNGFLIVCNDISEEHKRETERQRTQIMEATGSMAGGVAHEFNNILMGIQGYVSLMLLDTSPSHDHYAKLKAVEEQIKSGSNLTEQLLERSRGGRVEFKTLEPNDFIARLALVAGQMRSDIHITEQYSTYVWAIEADANLLEQAFQSIFANAARLLAGSGTLLLTTDNLMLDESHAAPHGIKAGPYVRMSIVLAETWMDGLTRQQLFSPSIFKDDGYRAGRNLSFAYGIVKGHDGMIEVANDPVCGTAFHVYLPASSKTPHKKKQDVPASKTRTGSETILLVDDEKVITDVTGAMLTALGYKVITASNGEEAVAAYQKSGDHIDVVIMDIVMPGMGGGEAIDLIRAINPAVKVILCSGYSMSGAVKAIMDKGVRHFLKKPFQLDEFSRTLREVLNAE